MERFRLRPSRTTPAATATIPVAGLGALRAGAPRDGAAVPRGAALLAGTLLRGALRRAALRGRGTGRGRGALGGRRAPHVRAGVRQCHVRERRAERLVVGVDRVAEVVLLAEQLALDDL